MSEFSDWLGPVERVTIGEARRIGRAFDRMRQEMAAEAHLSVEGDAEPSAEDAEEFGYRSLLATIAAFAQTRHPGATAEMIEGMAGGYAEFVSAGRKILDLAGFSQGEAMPPATEAPAPAVSSAPSAISMPPSPPAADTRPRKSTR